MHAEERTRLRELSAQLAFLLLAALSTIAMIVMIVFRIIESTEEQRVR